MTRKDLGPTPVGVKDQLTLGWARTVYPSFSSYIETPSDFTIILPEDPVEHQMEIFEIKAVNNRALIFMPADVVFCLGTHPAVTLEAGKTGFFGFRYSSHAESWFLLSTSFQV